MRYTGPAVRRSLLAVSINLDHIVGDHGCMLENPGVVRLVGVGPDDEWPAGF